MVASTANSHDAPGPLSILDSVTPSTLKELSLNSMPFPSSRYTLCFGLNGGGDSQSDMAVLRPFFSWRGGATSFRSRFWRECSTARQKLWFMPLPSVGYSPWQFPVDICNPFSPTVIGAHHRCHQWPASADEGRSQPPLERRKGVAHRHASHLHIGVFRVGQCSSGGVEDQ